MSFCGFVKIALIIFSLILFGLITAAVYFLYFEKKDLADVSAQQLADLQSSCDDSTAVVKRMKREAEEDRVRRESEVKEDKEIIKDIDRNVGGETVTNPLVYAGIGLIVVVIIFVYWQNRKDVHAFFTNIKSNGP